MLNKFLFAALFAWISFFPEPVQGEYCVYTILFLAIFLLGLFFNKNNLRLFSLKDWPLWLLLLGLLSGTIVATDKSIAWTTYSNLVLPLFLLFYLGKGLLAIDENGNTVSAVICICSLIVAIIGLGEFYFGKNILYENFIINIFYERYRFVGRPMSTLQNPVILGTYLLGCFPFGLFLLKNKSVNLRLLGVAALLLSAFVIILTFSRGVFLGFMVMLFFYLWQEHKTKLLKVFALCLVAVIIFCTFQKNVNLTRFGFQRLIAGSYDSILSEYRFERVKMTARIFKDHPFLGIGFNHFRIRFNEYCSLGNSNEIYEFRIPDNMYLMFLAETGLIGSIGFLLFIGFLLKSGLKKVKNRLDSQGQVIFVSLVALIGLLINMGAYELFYWWNPYLFFCLLCGFVAAPRSKSAKINK
ncbi:MAG: O-antigen ligase family protein [Candidatus Omnitrophica bacterium]|nr:O-antigen ligase family protein [Candidatus Omnitrophota bacterium]